MAVPSIYNSTAASALAVLTGTTKALEANQIQVASGKRVNEAADNAAYWSIATTMNSQSVSLSTADDATGMAAAVADTAALGVEAAAGIVSEIQQRLIVAQSLGSGRGAVDKEITALKDQLSTVASSSSFNGQNWLQLNAGQQPKVETMVASVTNNDGGVQVNVISFDTANSTLVSGQDADDGILTRTYSGTSSGGTPYEYYLLDAGSATPPPASAQQISVNDNTSYDEFEGMISSVNAMFSRLADAGSQIGATRNRIASSSEMLKDLQDTTQIGIGRLVDADMGEQAALMKALQAQQSLQTQQLNIANKNAMNVLSLFR